VKEALINTDGMVEVEKAKFSIEPLLKVEDQFFNWANVNSSQSLEENYLPIPSVNWLCSGIELETKVFANGEANINSNLYLSYKLKNTSSDSKSGSLFLLIRPYQVNPHYQFLNLPGGAGKINSISENDGKIIVDDKNIIPITAYNSFSAAYFDEG